jgi:hypothetical protein
LEEEFQTSSFASTNYFCIKEEWYRLNKPNIFIKKVKANYYQPEEYFSDSDCGTANYIKDHHTPAGLIDHDYIWQAKQEEVAAINSNGPATAEATTHLLLSYKYTTHNIQPKTETIHKQSFGTLIQGNTNYLIFKKLLPTGNGVDNYTYFTETTFIRYCGSHAPVQPYRVRSHIANNFNQGLFNLKHCIELTIYGEYLQYNTTVNIHALKSTKTYYMK